MRRYAPYIRYNKAMAATFQNPSFSLETRYVPYQFYHFIELFRKYGGKQQTVDTILRANGLTEQELAEAYSSFYGSGGTQGENGGVSSAELLSAIKEYLPYAVRLQGMDAGSYAGTSAEERQVDSMIWTLIETYQSAGGSMADIESDENYRKLDKSRARRLSEEYSGRPQ